MRANILRNWQTSGSGVISALAALVAIFYPDHAGKVNQVAAAISVLFGAIFALVAKDGNRSGTAANPVP